MAGIEVTKSSLDARSSEAVLDLRVAFRKVENVAKWLVNQTDTAEGDPLLALGYNADEAYLLRTTFEQLETVRTGNVPLWDTARRLTGLE